MRKTTIFTLTLLSLAILPVMAQQDQTLVGQVWSDFQSYSKDLHDYFQDNLSENLNPLEVESQKAFTQASNEGELKIPNPVVAAQKVRNEVIDNSQSQNSHSSESRASRFENNAAVRGNLVGNELNRLMTRVVAQGVIGKNAQSRIQGKLQSMQEELVDNSSSGVNDQLNVNCGNSRTANFSLCQGIQGLANTLLNPNSETILMQKLQAKIVAETFAQSIQTNQSLQYSNLNLANISQQAEEANRARRVDTSTEAARLLRATSQIDLFRSPSEKKVDKSDLRR